MTKSLKRCAWVNMKNPLYIDYHDKEWGRPLKDSQKLFELLCLEGAQAGLSWETILNKRDNYRKAFFNFNPNKMASLTEKQMQKLREDKSIIRNRLKISAFKTNAQSYLKFQKENGDFSKFLWSFTDGKTKYNSYKTLKTIPTQTTESEQMSKELKKLGFRFIGPTICYAFMQSAGMVHDHTTDCFLYKKK